MPVGGVSWPSQTPPSALLPTQPVRVCLRTVPTGVQSGRCREGQTVGLVCVMSSSSEPASVSLFLCQMSTCALFLVFSYAFLIGLEELLI